MQSHIRKVRVYLAVTCHLNFWQNDWGLLRATAVTWGWNEYQNKSQHWNLTLGKKILPPLLQGFEPATFRSQVRHSNHWAILKLETNECTEVFVKQETNEWTEVFVKLETNEWIEVGVKNDADEFCVCVRLETNELIAVWVGGYVCVKLGTNEWIEVCVWSLRQLRCVCVCVKLETKEWICVCMCFETWMNWGFVRQTWMNRGCVRQSTNNNSV